MPQHQPNDLIGRAVDLAVFRWLDELVLFLPDTHSFVDAEALTQRPLLQLLTECKEWTPREQVVARLEERANASREVANAAVDELLALGLLKTKADHYSVQALGAEAPWERTGWVEPYRYLWATIGREVLDYSRDGDFALDVNAMLEFSRKEDPPSNYKNYPDAPFRPLEQNPTVTARTVAEVLADEVGGKKEPDSFTFTLFSWLTHLAYGQTNVRYLPVTGAHVAKTSPSGGSRHPTEVYPLVFDVDGLEPALYHFSVQRDGLELLKPGNHLDFMRRHLLQNPALPRFQPKVVYLYSTIFDRSMFRYREPFSYRVMHHDLGHLMQTTALLTSGIRRNSLRFYTPDDGATDRFLGIDGLFESAMAFTVIG